MGDFIRSRGRWGWVVDTDGAHCSLRLRHHERLALLEELGGQKLKVLEIWRAL